jgi:hypothetical protein
MQSNTNQFGQTALRIVEASAEATGSPAHSTALKPPSDTAETLTFLRSLPARLDDTQLARVREIAQSSLVPLPPVSPKQFVAAMRKLSILPRRADDEMTGEERVKVYARMFGSYPAEAIGYMTRRALEECQWFPTPAQCLNIIGGYQRSDQARSIARAYLHHETERRWAEMRARYALACRGGCEIPQDEIDALPEYTKRALADAYLLRFGPDGWGLRLTAKVFTDD